MRYRMKLLPLLFVFFGVSLCEVGKISEEEDIKLERQVKMMNKPPVKTFTTEEGSTIDYIDTDKQPSLEHPSLKNHKVQQDWSLVRRELALPVVDLIPRHWAAVAPAAVADALGEPDHGEPELDRKEPPEHLASPRDSSTRRSTWMWTSKESINANRSAELAKKTLACRGTNISGDDDIKLEEQLKLLNKPPVMTFLTEEGDTIDCVNIDKQPALDHPLLKNHKVHRKPNLPLRSSKTSSRTKYVQFRSRKPCPIGTVPIQRIKKEDLIRTRSLPKMPYANMVGNEDAGSREPSGIHRVTIRQDRHDIIKYGASAHISVYNLTVSEDQYSQHNVWISTGPLDRFSMIVAGWQVYPGVGGDHLPRLFTFWTGNSWRDGCFNTLCQGFVQVDRMITPNYPLTPESAHGGPIYELKVEVSQDIHTRSWWLRVHDPPINVGYWPKELFANLQDGTFTAAWGGAALESADGYCPPMGNGVLPDKDYRKAAYFRDIQWMNARGESFLTRQVMPVEVDAPPSCYGLLDLKLRGEPWGYYFSFGGPGGYCRA